MKFSINPRVAYTIFSAVLILSGTLVAIEYAKGNIRFTRDGVIQDTGLLSANSFPPGAQVYLNGELSTVTDETLYLEPGIYNVEIKKDGFSPWRKTIELQNELVTQTNAQLFPIAPRLSPLTFTGAKKLLPSPDGEKILFLNASASAENKNGIYVLELNSNVLPLNRQAKQIAFDKSQVFDFANSQYIWSPDSSQVLVTNGFKDILLEADRKTDVSQLPNIRKQKQEILSQWQEEMYLRERQFLSKFPEEIIKIATESAENVYISPDKKRLLYTATANLAIPDDLLPPLPSSNTQEESRNIEFGKIYVYDSEEDKNFLVGQAENLEKSNIQIQKQSLAIDLYNDQASSLESSPSAFLSLQGDSDEWTAQNFAVYHSSLSSHGIQWFTDSKHIVYVQEGKVFIKEYDNSNETTIYSGPFEKDFVYPWPDGSKLVIVTSFSPDNDANLYAIELK